MSKQPKLALITGGNGGIGQEIACQLAKNGWDIALNYLEKQISADSIAARVQQLGQNCWVFAGDVGQADQVQAMFLKCREEARVPDLLVNNAAVQTWASLLELTEEDWDRTIRTNLKGTFLCTQQAARLMKETGNKGRIINIGSGANKFPFPNLLDYCASKGGIENLTKVAALELGPDGIRVNCIAPGAIEIERTKKESPDYAKTWGSITPLRRIGLPQDIAKAVVWLAGDESDFITGQTIYVDGGLFSQPPWPYDSNS